MSWPNVSLGEICSPKQHKTIPTSSLLPEGYPVYGANGQIGCYSEYTHSDTTVAITCRGATCGTINVAPPKSYITGNAMALDRLDRSRVDIRFLVYALRHRGLHDVISGSAQPQITRGPLLDVKIPLPPMEEQKRIAAILDQADDIRRKRQHAIDRLNQLGQAIFYEMFGNEGTTIRISEYLEDIQSGKNLVGVSDDDASDYRVLKISAVSKMGFRPSETKPLPSNYIPPSEHLVSNGDLIFSRANTTELVGIPCIVEGVEPNVALPDKLWRLVAAPQKADRNFLNFALRSPSSRHQIEKMCSGTSGSMQNISMQKFNSILIPKAALSDQEQFAKRVGQVSAVLQQVSVQQWTTNSLFASLQHRAFAGEI